MASLLLVRLAAALLHFLCLCRSSHAFSVAVPISYPVTTTTTTTTTETATLPEDTLTTSTTGGNNNENKNDNEKRRMPRVSPATGLENQIYEWKEGYRIRYQCNGDENGEPIVLVHGLFVCADHWRKSLLALGDAGYRVYALDLFGCGYSDKPPANSEAAQRCNGERSRYESVFASNNDKDADPATRPTAKASAVASNVVLGTAKGGKETRICDVELCHPLGSPYNFYTWADLIDDFCQHIVLNKKTNGSKTHSSVTLMCNSIGTMSSLQAVLDFPERYKGVMVVAPNFRELHSAEIPFSALTMPIVRGLQYVLRNGAGQALFSLLAKPETVKQILMEPYAVAEAVDDTLVKVLLDPLLTEGAVEVVLDTLCYSAGPLPEYQLQQFPVDKPVWIGYGTADPWTPGPRVEAMRQFSTAVERVVAWEGVGHCPHDEAPDLVHEMLFQFLERLQQKEQ